MKKDTVILSVFSVFVLATKANASACVEANAQRAVNGVAALACSSELNSIAQQYTQTMCSTGCFGHGCGGTSPADRLDSAGISYQSWAENVAEGDTTAPAVVNSWMNSPPHRANILRGSSTHAGEGYLACGDRHLWTLVFIGDGSASGGSGGGINEGGGVGKVTTRRSRRLAQPDIPTVKEGDHAYRKAAKKCGEHLYKLSLAVDDHFYGVASPDEDALAMGCPYVVVHAHFRDGQEGYEKVIQFIHNEADFKDMFPTDDMLVVGEFKASAVIQVNEKIDPQMNGGATFYNILANNCANYMIELAQGLDIKVNTEMTTFVARRLLKNLSTGAVEQVRSNLMGKFSTLFHRNLRSGTSHAAPPISDEEVIKMAIGVRVKGFD